MSCFNDKFKKVRLDQSPYLFHFVNGEDKVPWTTLQKILESKKLISQRHDYVCFSASPITAIKRFFDVKVNRTGQPMYHPWGIGFSRDILVKDFKARNVIYHGSDEAIPEELTWRSQLLNVESYDFEYLREWRIKGREFDFSTFPKEHMIVVAPDTDSLNHVITKFDMKFNPIVNYYTGDIEEDWDEAFTREWKGIAVDNIGEYLDDFAVSGSTQSQTINEDMLPIIFNSALNVASEK